MNNKPSIFTTFRILHLALLIGLSLFAVVAFVLVKLTGFKSIEDENVDRVFQIVAVLISIIVLVVGFNMFKKKITLLRDSPDPADKKLEQYRAACITWWGMIEGPGLFAIISFILTGNYAFLALAFFHIGILVVFGPRKDNIIQLLNLNTEEVEQLEGNT